MERKSLDFLGYPKYSVCNNGTVWRWLVKKKIWKLRKPQIQRGYYVVNLFNSEQYKYKVFLIHRLVAFAFVGPQPQPNYQVCHNDGNRFNNNSSNLRWDTRSNNQQDSIKHGTFVRGERNGRAKLTEDNIRFIRASLGKIRGSKLAKIFGVSHTKICHIFKNKSWKHVT